MATLYDGLPVFTATTGNDVLAADWNTLQDKLILGLEDRSNGISPDCGWEDQVGASNWVYIGLNTAGGASAPRWSNGVCANNHEVCIPIETLRYNERITELNVYIGGSRVGAAGDQGEIGLYRKELDGTAVVAVQDIGGADPWNQAGANVVLSAVGLSIDVLENESYFLRFRAHNSGAGQLYIWLMYYNSQFHKGT